jgi:hypothetical protein
MTKKTKQPQTLDNDVLYARWKQAEADKEEALAALQALPDDAPEAEYKRLQRAWSKAIGRAIDTYSAIPDSYMLARILMAGHSCRTIKVTST